jgi:hypothetical protein
MSNLITGTFDIKFFFQSINYDFVQCEDNAVYLLFQLLQVRFAFNRVSSLFPNCARLKPTL